jgi:ATP-dependent DNA helicase DinG
VELNRPARGGPDPPDRRPDLPGRVDPLFRPGGALARALPGFEARPQQARMAAEVAGALAGGSHLLVEAGTGVGKSLAYLVPAILWSLEGGADGEPRRVIVSTWTRALQEQLARKDLPFLERALAPAGIVFRHALLMGSENYLCVQRLHELRARRGDLVEDEEGGAIRDLAAWAEGAPTGLRGEIPRPVPAAVWDQVRRDRDLCLGPRGPYWDRCLYRRDLLRAREAEILVVNHALFFLDLATGGRILPPHGAVILDEAHRVEDAAATQIGLSLSHRAVARLIGDLAPPGASPRPRRRRAGGGRGADPVDRAAARAAAATATFFRDLVEAGRERAARAAPAAGAWSARVRQAGLVPDSLHEPLRDLEAALEESAARSADPALALARQGLAGRARDLRERASAFLAQRIPEGVYWIEGVEARPASVSLHAVPAEVGPILRQRLFDSGRTVVLTSATLAAQGSFAHIRDRLGLPAGRAVTLGSPFDHRRQALLYLAPDIPDPVREPAPFAEAVIARVRDLIDASDGGAFVLFTSWALLARAAEALGPDCRRRDRPIFRHLPGEAASILERFRASRRGVLLGTLTFWQGVDVPGEALRSVILTRLPFDSPEDPLAEARGEAIRARGGDPFQDLSLPEAILTFRQGFGRLIRTRDDRGLVAVLDPRVGTRGYGAAFLESLPDCPRTADLGAVARFFRSGPAPE